jgi:predicted RNase H-like nuclease
LTFFTLTDEAVMWLAGVDGCAGGWIAAFVRPSGDEAAVAVFAHFKDVLEAPQRPAIVAVDVPDRSAATGRLWRAGCGERGAASARCTPILGVFGAVARRS